MWHKNSSLLGLFLCCGLDKRDSHLEDIELATEFIIVGRAHDTQTKKA